MEWGGERGAQGDQDLGGGGGSGREEEWEEGGGGGAGAGQRARELQTSWLRPAPALSPALGSRRSASAREDVPAEAAAGGGATRAGLLSTRGRQAAGAAGSVKTAAAPPATPERTRPPALRDQGPLRPQAAPERASLPRRPASPGPLPPPARLLFLESGT